MASERCHAARMNVKHLQYGLWKIAVPAKKAENEAIIFDSLCGFGIDPKRIRLVLRLTLCLFVPSVF